jgi:hypothetical protein
MDTITNDSTGSKISNNSLVQKILKAQSEQKKDISAFSNNSYDRLKGDIKDYSTDVSIIKDCLNFN